MPRIRVPKPRAKAKGMSLFPKLGKPKTGKSIYKKSALIDDPTKYGNFGYDINQLTPIFGKK